MRLRLGLLLVIVLTAAPAASRAQSANRGWFLSVRAGLGLARARCDSPCVPPRKHVGPEITYAAGHGVGDRATIALTFFGFGAPGEKSSREGWIISNGG